MKLPRPTHPLQLAQHPLKDLVIDTLRNIYRQAETGRSLYVIFSLYSSGDADHAHGVTISDFSRCLTSILSASFVQQLLFEQLPNLPLVLLILHQSCLFCPTANVGHANRANHHAQTSKAL